MKTDEQLDIVAVRVREASRYSGVALSAGVEFRVCATGMPVLIGGEDGEQADGFQRH